jgi:hypothetical protein
LAGLALQIESARIGSTSWAAPDFLVLVLLGWHWLWGLGSALVVAALLGVLVDGLSGMPVGLNVSGLILAALIVDRMRGAAAGGFGGPWVGPAFAAALGAGAWRWLLWGWGNNDWAPPLDVLFGALLTMGVAAVVAYLRRRMIHPRSRRPRVVEP